LCEAITPGGCEIIEDVVENLVGEINDKFDETQNENISKK